MKRQVFHSSQKKHKNTGVWERFLGMIGRDLSVSKFPSPTGYMLTSFGFLHWLGLYSVNPSKLSLYSVIGHFFMILRLLKDMVLK